MFEIKIHITETNKWIDNPDLRFTAFNEQFRENIMAGYGATPYEALHNLVNEFFEAEIFRGEIDILLKVLNGKNDEKHKHDMMCPHTTTNPLQLKQLCKRCRLLDQKNISVYQMPQGDWGCSVGDPNYTAAIVGFGIISDGFKTRKDAEEWALNKATKL